MVILFQLMYVQCSTMVLGLYMCHVRIDHALALQKYALYVPVCGPSLCLGHQLCMVIAPRIKDPPIIYLIPLDTV